MPRRSRRAATDEEQRKERTVVFEKTKMCKFHILGCCLRGDGCQFAHHKTQLQSLPDLRGTKLCKTLIATGRCDDPECSYAHCQEDLREVEGFTQNEEKPVSSGAGQDRAPSSGYGGGSGNTKAQRQLPQQDQMGSHFANANAQRSKASQNIYPQMAMPPGAQVPFFGYPMDPAPAPPSLRDTMAAFQSQAHGMDAAAKQAAMQQMGLAAQAHAAEALRLQAMAACLHGHQGQSFGMGSGPCGGSSSKGQPIMAQAMQMFGPCGFGGQNMAMPDEYGSGRGAGNGFSQGSTASQAMQQTQRRPHEDDDNEAFKTNEPTKIPLGSLRSLSSQSLPVEPDEDDRESSSRGSRGFNYDGSTLNLKVKNTFLDFDAGTPLASKLRSVFSAAGRLDSLGEEVDSMIPAPAASEKRSQDTPMLNLNANSKVEAAAARGLGMSGHDLQGDASAEAATSSGSTPVSRGLGNGLSRYAPDLNMSGWKSFGESLTVKNTFLDFATDDTPPHALRAVRTAAGRLDIMSQFEEE